jgi:hypothetical protein
MSHRRNETSSLGISRTALAAGSFAKLWASHPEGTRRLIVVRKSVIALVIFGFAIISQAKDGGWDFEPYRVQITIAIDAPGGLAEQLSDELPRYLRNRVDAALAPAWSCDVHIAAGRERTDAFASMAASEPSPPALAAGKDKLLLATLRWRPDSMQLTAREFDGYVQRWSTPIRRESRQVAGLPEQLFALIRQAFSPLAHLELDAKDPHLVVLAPRGAMLPRRAGAAPWAKAGDVFLPVLRRTTRSGQLEKKGGIQTVPWTYIETTRVKDDEIVGRIESANRRPLIVRWPGHIEQLAIALRADPDTTVLQLHSRTDAGKRLVGYEVFLQEPGEEKLSRIGMTDAAGQIPILPGPQRIQFAVVKHGNQLLARIPVAAGAGHRVEVALPDDDARLAAEAHLAAVREDLIDVVARRNILISRAREKIRKKDFAAAQELLQTLDDLPGRPQFDISLSTAQRTLHSDDPHMQRRIDQLFAATQSLFGKYLDLRPINEIHDELREAQAKAPLKQAEPQSTKKS